MGGNLETVKLLLSTHPDVVVTEAVLEAAAGNKYYNLDLTKLFISKYPDITITEAVLVEVVGMRGSRKVVMMLSKWCGLGWREEGVVGVVQRVGMEYSLEINYIVKLLLSRYPGIAITERVLAAAAGSYCDDGKILGFLLATCPDLVITDNVILVALNDQLRYLKAFELLLSTHPDIGITEELLNAVARNRHQALKILISRHLHFKTTETVAVKMGEGSQSLEVLEILLSTSPDFQITEAMVLALLQPSSISMKALEFLFSNFRDVQITKAVVAAELNDDLSMGNLRLPLSNCPDV